MHAYYSLAGTKHQSIYPDVQREHGERDINKGLLELANKVIADEGGQVFVCKQCKNIFIRQDRQCSRNHVSTLSADYCDFCNGVHAERKEIDRRVYKVRYAKEKEARG